MTTILLVRHGFSVANSKGIFAGHTDVELSQTGVLQAELVCDYVNQNFKVDAVYSSDLQRAFKTVEGIARFNNMQVIPTKEFREIFAGDWEGITFDDIKLKFPNEYDTWIKNTGFARCNNGESMQELQTRAYNKLLDIAKQNDGKTVVIGTHAGVIRALECKITNVELCDMKLVGWVANASVTLLKFNGETFECDTWGFSDHLANLKTDVPTNI